jgi:hypothetical protein
MGPCREAGNAANKGVIAGSVDAGRRSQAGSGIVKEDLPAGSAYEVRELRGSRAIFSPTACSWADERYRAVTLLDKDGLTPDENALHFMSVAVENR